MTCGDKLIFHEACGMINDSLYNVKVNKVQYHI